MIEVCYKGRLGNNMFQYCLGRILAEDLGFGLRVDPIAAFPKTAEYVNGARYMQPEQILTGHQIDLAAILADRDPRKIILDGWFQCYQYYRRYRHRIREWLAFDPGICVPEVQPEVVVHVRRDDYVSMGRALPFSYYEAALSHLSPTAGKIWIVSDDLRDPFFQRFASWKPKFFSGTPAQDMRFMASAPRLVMSQSTFSWWPTFLGNPKEIVCPVSSFGAWSKWGGEAARDIDLIERDRFICLECNDAYQPTEAEVRHQAWRAARRRITSPLKKWFRLAQRAQ